MICKSQKPKPKTWGQEIQDLLMGKKNYVLLLLLVDGAVDGFKKKEYVKLI